MTKNDTPGSAQNPLTQRQRQAIAALLSEPTVQAAADASNISRVTIYRYLANPAFRDALSEAQNEVLRMNTARLSGLLSRALDHLGEVFESSKNTTARTRAADIVLRHVAGLMAYVDLGSQIRDIERRLKDAESESEGIDIENREATV